VPERSFLVYGLGITGRALASALIGHGATVRCGDDAPSAETLAWAQELSVDVVTNPDVPTLKEILSEVDAVVPTPGLPERHRLWAAARDSGAAILSEFDLAQAWDGRPLVSITGTNGKTTVTMLVTEMLNESGLRAAAVGNTDTPLVAALEDEDTQVFVVESSSFRLGATRTFRPRVATWLNFAEDHLDVHRSLAVYEAAKARSWSDLGPESAAIGNLDDSVVAAHLGEGNGRAVGFTATPQPTSAYRCADGVLLCPDGTELVRVDELPRALPHDISNSLAAAATALEAGASLDAVRRVLRRFTGLAHRVEFVAEIDGVAFYDDSKATAPHAVRAAVNGFESVVLIAGGKNKGLDLSVLGSLAPPVRAVVAIGDSAPEVVAAFPDLAVTVGESMMAAVALAKEAARSGDAVVLSPGCASFDWYRNYGERGEDFARCVRAIAGADGGVCG
jgi:UDP-N-acetylmuramoylalanine--D-glutamate ligase